MNLTPYKIMTDLLKNHKSMKFRNGMDNFQTFIYTKTNEGFLVANYDLIFEIDVFSSNHKNYPAIIHFLHNNDKNEIFRSYKIEYDDVKQLLGRKDLENVQMFINAKMKEEHGPKFPPKTKVKI